MIVTQHSWLSLQEFADLVAIAEMTPGPIAINAATFVGTRLAGIPGALTATLGGRGHDRLGRRPDSDERSLGRRGRDACGHDWAMAAIFAVCLVLLRKTKLSPILVMLLAGAVNLLLPA